MTLKINKIIICFLIALFLFACSKANRDITERDEIEPNDSHEYAQFIDSNILIKANLDFEDIDYYKISPTNGFIMDFSIKADNYFNNIILSIGSIDSISFEALAGLMEWRKYGVL